MNKQEAVAFLNTCQWRLGFMGDSAHIVTPDQGKVCDALHILGVRDLDVEFGLISKCSAIAMIGDDAVSVEGMNHLATLARAGVDIPGLTPDRSIAPPGGERGL
jgi:hypothetical protein